MSAPPKPWENSGAGDSRTFQMPASMDQNLVGQIAGNNASQPTSLLGPTPTAGVPTRRRPPPPATAAANRALPTAQTAYGAATTGAYGNTYGNSYGNTYGGGYGSTYGSSLGSYGLGSYGSGIGTYGIGLGTYGSGLGTYGSSYGSSYGNSYGSPYGGYGMGSGYGSYGQRFGGYGSGPYPPTPESRLVSLAAESSRPAFESIESVVQTFGSVSFMLESTLGALHSSFRAVLAVADHLGRLRAIFSAMALFRFARMLYGKLMRMLGLSPAGAEAAWSAAGPEPGSAPDAGAAWPLAAFVGVVVAAPYLAYRLLQRMVPPPPPPQPQPQQQQPPAWLAPGRPVWRATSRHAFAPQTPDELALAEGQAVFLAPQPLQTLHDGWVLASDGAASGLVPKAFLGDVTQVISPNARAPRTAPAIPTAAHRFPPDAAEPVISPDGQAGQPGKPVE